MYKQNQILVEMLQPIISSMGYELWGIEHTTTRQGATVRIYLDSESGITMADCARVSEQIAGVFDVNDPIYGSYSLEVSSPGLDRPLFTVTQFKRYIGQQVRIKLYEKIDGRRNFTGEINTVDQCFIGLFDAGNEYCIPADTIEKAHLVLKM